MGEFLAGGEVKEGEDELIGLHLSIFLLEGFFDFEDEFALGKDFFS